jgi:hypothetical protein
MAERIKLVQGDNLPSITLKLTREDGSPINLDDPDIFVRVFFRQAGSETVLATLICEKVAPLSDGVVRFNFPGTTLNVDPGFYEGEVSIDYDGLIETVYETLKFSVRQQFA